MSEPLESLSAPSADTPISFEKQTVSEDVFLGVMRETIDALDAESIPYLVIGGVASAIWGRPRWTQDIDVLVRPQDARTALDALGSRGYHTQETYEHWLYKGMKDDVVVDLLFQSSGGIYLDDEMLERSEYREFGDLKLRLAAPEDLIVMKSLAHEEATPRYWHDALGIIARAEIDWGYLLRRARTGARRILSLLLYAQSADLVVPDRVVRELFEVIQEGESGGNHGDQ